MEPAWEWHVGDPIGTGSDVGAPEVPYMSYGPKRKKEREESPQMYSRNDMADDAWQLYEEGRYSEALDLINEAVGINCTVSRFLNLRAIILDAMERYDEAIKDYGRVIELEPSQTYERNKGVAFKKYAEFSDENGEADKAYIMILRAIRIFEKLNDEKHLSQAWSIKGNLLEKRKCYLKAFNAYKKAVMYSKDDKHMKRVYEIYRDNIGDTLNLEELKCPKCGHKLNITV